jgi:hypothetical protein
MKRKKPTLENKVNAILDRDEGIPYSKVLAVYDITPTQFHRAVQSIHSFIQSTAGTTRQALEKIASDAARKRELFRMGEEFIREQYEGMLEGRQGKFCDSTLLHPENVENLVYYALARNNPQLASKDRKEVVEGIKGISKDLARYLKSIGLCGLMLYAFEKERINSPLAVLEVFDTVYQQKTGDSSLFDLTQKEHLHEWGDTFYAPHSYWHNPVNVERAVYHILTENNPQLASKDRNKVIEDIKNFPGPKGYFYKLGLASVMRQGPEKRKQDLPLAILEIFDRVYQRKTGNPSLFDKTQENYLEVGKRNILTRR